MSKSPIRPHLKTSIVLLNMRAFGLCNVMDSVVVAAASSVGSALKAVCELKIKNIYHEKTISTLLITGKIWTVCLISQYILNNLAHKKICNNSRNKLHENTVSIVQGSVHTNQDVSDCNNLTDMKIIDLCLISKLANWYTVN